MQKVAWNNMSKWVALKSWHFTSLMVSFFSCKKVGKRDFPGGPVVGNLPSRVRDPGAIPGLGTKIPHAMGQLGARAATTLEPKPQQGPSATARTQHGKINKHIF